MCYFIYGSLYGNVEDEEYEKIQKKYNYRICRGTKHDIKTAVKNVSDDFRVTDDYCDCDSALGKHDASDVMIKELCDMIKDYSALDGVQQINICKTWAGKENKKEIKLSLKNLDVAEFLAEMNENSLYCIDIDR